MKLPVKATETKSGKGKVIDDHGFSVCNIGGGSYAEQRMVAAQIAKAVNHHDRLGEALERVLNAKRPEDYRDARALLAELDNLEKQQ